MFPYETVFFEPMEGVEPTTPRLQITCSGQLSYIGNYPYYRGSSNVLARGLSCYKYITNLEDIFAQESLPPRVLAVSTRIELVSSA